jgi:hypothetical protein
MQMWLATAGMLSPVFYDRTVAEFLPLISLFFSFFLFFFPFYVFVL